MPSYCQIKLYSFIALILLIFVSFLLRFFSGKTYKHTTVFSAYTFYNKFFYKQLTTGM